MAAAVAARIPRADPLASVRRWEAQHGRVLVDPSLAAWRDMDSEAVDLARQRWRVRLPRGTAYWSRRHYLSFDERGRPERLIDLRLLSADQGLISTRHSDLLVAANVGARYWVYALAPASLGQMHLSVVQDPAALAWDPPGLLAGVGQPVLEDPPWLLPLSRAGGSSVLLNAA